MYNKLYNLMDIVVMIKVIKVIKDMWTRITCKHKYTLKETVHGDRIIHLGYTRSIWLCTKCNKAHFSKYTDKV